MDLVEQKLIETGVWIEVLSLLILLLQAGRHLNMALLRYT